MRSAQDGDQRALDTLLRRHYNQMYAICRRMTGNDADAADATQEALITITKRLDRFMFKSKFTTWMYRVTTNSCLDEMRRRGRRPIPGIPNESMLEADGSINIATEIVNRLELDAALATLPPEFRAPVILRDQLGMDYAEISATLEIPPGTVRSRIARGRKRLADLLGNQDDPSQRLNKDQS